jgi:hypothetical protein
MPTPDPNKAWMLFMSDPVTFILIFAAVVLAVGGFVWWFRGHIGKERIAASKERIAVLDERLRLAHDRYGAVRRVSTEPGAG